jgi:hypothetical protein
MSKEEEQSNQQDYDISNMVLPNEPADQELRLIKEGNETFED